MPTSNSDHTTRHLNRPHINKSKMYYLRKHRGTTGRIPVTHVREHINILHNELGLPYASIARVAGVSICTIHDYAQRTDRHLAHTLMAQAILNVNWTPHPLQHHCLAIGALRRAHALARIGWSLRWQAAALNENPASYLRRLNRTCTSYRRWAAVRDLYDQYSATPGTGQRTINAATRSGWASPLAWEGIDIDNPNATPNQGDNTPVIDWVVVDRLTAGRAVPHTRAERLAALALLSERGASADAIARILPMSERTVVRNRNKLRHTKAA